MTALKLCNAIMALLLVCSMAAAFHMISPEKAAETITTTTLSTTTNSALKRVAAAAAATSDDGSASPTSAIDMELTTIQTTAEQQSSDAGPTTAPTLAKQPPATNDDESASIGSSEENPEITATSTPLTSSSSSSSSTQVPPATTTMAAAATGAVTTRPTVVATIGVSATGATATTSQPVSRVEAPLSSPTTTKSVITAAAAVVGHKEAAAAGAPKLKEDNASEDLDYMKDAPFDEEDETAEDGERDATDSNEMKPKKPHELSERNEKTSTATREAKASNVTSNGSEAPTSRPSTSSTGSSTSSTSSSASSTGASSESSDSFTSSTGSSTSSTGFSSSSTGSSGSSTGTSTSASTSFTTSSDISSTASDIVATATPLTVTTVSPILKFTTKTVAPSVSQRQEEATSTIGSSTSSNGESVSTTTKETGGQMNIADLYPVRLEDFGPIIRDSNAELLRERTIFKATDNEEHRQNLMPNEVEDHQQLGSSSAGVRLNQKESPPGFVGGVGTISDFTGKLLAEQDGVITEIEQKFRLTAAEEEAREAKPGEPVKRDKLSFSVNHQIPQRQHYPQFIERRVKKSFEFPMHRVAADGVLQPHVDFAQTKFNTDNSRHPPALVAGGLAERSAGGALSSADKGPDDLAPMPLGAHPEFSTTKFYNSKELYNEMMMHNHNSNNNNNNKNLNNNNGGKPKTMTIIMPQYAATTTEPAPPVKSTGPPKVLKQKLATALPIAKFRSFQHLTDFRPSNQKIATTSKPSTVKAAVTGGEPTITAAEKLRKIQKDLKRAKSLLEAVEGAKQEVGTTTTMTASAAVTQSSVTGSSSGQPQTMTANAIDREANGGQASTTSRSAGIPTATTINSSFGASSFASPSTSSDTTVTTTTIATNVNSPTMASLRPTARPRILRRLQEKINSLECEIQNVPEDSHLWRGNETHELLLPIVEEPKNCSHRDVDVEKCGPSTNSWNGEAEIQSGDVLIVEINDAALTQPDNGNPNSAHNTQVYQVTRSGHEHCDVTEGILLDITPLVVDGRKLVTLYDKDLTEGVNLLIVVSDLWGSQCVRLKVTTKTDNCGENADCSGKGVCYSNPAMEDYECQCCSGFAGPHCEEIDACTPSPCTNNGICVDLSQGHEGNSYQCLCPYGYSGKNCQYETDPCNPTECLNGGSCVGNSTHFRCDCTPGFTGPVCQHSLNECESSPCVHGICVDQEDGFRCFCQPGFAGELCNFEYNECESNPCQNSGECIDHIGSYECRCTKGYTGKRCQIKVDFCANKPCPDGQKCIDHGNEFSCQCPGGLNGLNCNQMPRTQCNVNPCTHGGTCWTSGESFYCACRPGYTGTMCEDEFVVETVVSSSEFIVDDTSARNLNDKAFGSSVVLKSPIELHNAYFAAGVLAAAIFIVAIVVTICHCKVNQTYRKFSTRTTTFFPILGFGRRPKMQNKLNKHWLSGKSVANASGGGNGGSGCPNGSGNPLRSSSSSASLTRGHLAATNGNQYTTTGGAALHERPFQRHLAMNLENDMYYTVDFSENSQHSPLIQ